MPITRRSLLSGGAAALAASLGEGFRAEDVEGWLPRPRVAWAAGRTRAMPPPSPELHLLNRATYGATAADVAHVKSVGTGGWVEEQISTHRIDDSATEQAVATLASVHWTMDELKANASRRPVRNELIAATLYRAVKSRRQLYEVAVDHWSNVFNVFHPEELISRVKTIDDREVIRANALGRFRPMLQASAQSLSMMRYLNTLQNTKSGPNENYAREVMELHTLGVDGGYTEADVKEVARCFTGWNRNNNTWAFEFRAADHDTGTKTVLGRSIAANGAAEGQKVLDLLVDRPQCAVHTARRLAKRFVADNPPDAVVNRVASVFGADGNIAAMLRALLNSPEFKASAAAPDGGPSKIKRPLEAWTSALRVLDAPTEKFLDVPDDVYEGDDGPGSVQYAGRAEQYLQLMDQIPFRWRPPDGYPDTGPRWGGLHVTISRWNFGLALAEGRLAGMPIDVNALMAADGVGLEAGEVVDYWLKRVVMRDVLAEDRALLTDFLTRGGSSRMDPDELRRRLPMLVALMLDSPYFHWR